MVQAVADITKASDASLAAQGDVHAFERLYREHAARVHTLVCRMLGNEEADEVTQDVFVRAWQRLGTFGGRSAFGTWLHRLAVNVILSHRKTLAIRRGRFTEDTVIDTLAARSPAPELSMDFEAAIDTLPEGARRVFVLHDVEGYKHEEITRLLGISIGTSKSQLHRARMLLRAHLE
jgi:RNA polymerase sigma-70 factor (ECF subfamily)